ncbi:MAG: GIY-YIG nuclease family protein [Gammaproteobacteria bacterium]|nr:GIY-YIG nuclease family protein [Gammaproteobacteria bacterium]MCW8909264.1 GIY-YIG nuclease family protein [Gammaproteobacteria bacterium]MCW9003756.1 GIY-YIG nuclease family protein [Gammaproteobacteria bacterium]MCW9056046.1 GIY-YIG nuclease family protein [Gammaproteobacteria bacterium]
MSDWYVYMVRCSDNSLYTGITIDIERRIDEHNNNNRLAAKYTRIRRPVSLVYSETLVSKSEAAKRECAIKQLSKQEKEQLISG